MEYTEIVSEIKRYIDEGKIHGVIDKQMNIRLADAIIQIGIIQGELPTIYGDFDVSDMHLQGTFTVSNTYKITEDGKNIRINDNIIIRKANIRTIFAYKNYNLLKEYIEE